MSRSHTNGVVIFQTSLEICDESNSSVILDKSGNVMSMVKVALLSKHS